MTRKKFGPMDIDYRYRCVKPNGHFDRIYYGHTAREYNSPGKEKVYDITRDYKDRSSSGRTAVCHEEQSGQHYFTKDLKRDEVIDALCRGGGGLQGRADAVRVRARNARGGKPVAEEIKTRERGLGSGAGGAGGANDYEEENCPGHVASPDDPRVCDRCGTHIDSLRPEEDD